MRRGDLNLYVTSLEAAQQFYAAALGFTVVESNESSRTMRSGDVAITLFPAETGNASPRGKTPGMTADLVVDELDAFLVQIQSEGGTVVSVESWEGGRFALFTDPDGIGWELIERGG